MIPQMIYLENFMSYSKTSLNFNQFKTALIIGSCDGDIDKSNAAGKTALFDAITWALFDKSRFRLKNKVIKRGELSCSVRFEFLVDKKVYKIIRKLNVKGISEVSIFVKSGDDWNDLTCDTSKITNKKIIEILKINYETFINSVYFRQHDLLRFANARAAERKEILKSLLQIGVWDKYQEEAKKKAKKLKDKYDSIVERIELLGDVNDDLDTNKKALISLELQILDIKKELETAENELKQIREEFSLIRADSTNIEEINKKLLQVTVRESEIVIRKEAINRQTIVNKDIIQTQQKEIEKLQKISLENARIILSIDNHKGKDKALSIVEGNVKNILKLDELKEKVNELKLLNESSFFYNQQISQTELLEPGEKCPICLQKVKNLSEVLEDRSRIIKNAKENIQKINESSKAIEKWINNAKLLLKKADNSLYKIKENELSIKQSKGKISLATSSSTQLNKELNRIEKEFNNSIIKKEELLLKLNNSNSKKMEEIKKKLKLAEREIKKLRQERIKLETKNGSLNGFRENLKRKQSEYNTLILQQKDINRDIVIHRRLIKAFGKNGVQAIIFENITEDLQNYTNKVLKEISNEPMTVEFITQRQTVNKSWSETFDIKLYIQNEIIDFDELSGGEQVRVSIAIRLALSKILMRRVGSNIKFLLLDEVDQALDKKGLESLSETIHLLSKEFKILIITHNDNMKDRFDHIITVHKDLNGSFIKQ